MTLNRKKKQVSVRVDEQDIREHPGKRKTSLECGSDTLEEIANICVKPGAFVAEKDNTGMEIKAASVRDPQSTAPGLI